LKGRFKVAHITYPIVFHDEDTDGWKCEMRDKKTNKVWGQGYGMTRQEAIYNARHDQPSAGKIKRAIGWVVSHPFIAGSAVGTYLAYRHARKHEWRLPPLGYLSIGAIIGTLAWGLNKIFHFSALASRE
jgi:hypothetical protein